MISKSKRQLKESFETFQTLLTIEPNHVDAHLFMGDIYLRIGQKDKAMQAYHIALKIDPDNKKAKKKINMLLSG